MDLLKIADLEKEIIALRQENQALRQELKRKSFTAEMIVDNDDLTRFYTGLPKYSVFKAVAKYISQKAQHISPWKTSSGSAECMSEDDNRWGAQP